MYCGKRKYPTGEKKKPIADRASKVSNKTKLVHNDTVKKKKIHVREIENPSVSIYKDSNAIKNAIQQDPVMDKSAVVYVYKGKIGCYSQHLMQPFIGTIIIGNDKQKLYIEYCYTCKKFLMKWDDYEEFIKEYGMFPLKAKIANESAHLFNMAEWSPLRMTGYTVSAQINLSKDKRERILSYIIDHKILKKREVLDYIERFIAQRKNMPNMKTAIGKWESDKKFVLQYNTEKCNEVEISELRRR